VVRWGKKLLSLCACDPSYTESIRMTAVQARPEHEREALLEKQLKQKGLEVWFKG
jgi:hypothetical protein